MKTIFGLIIILMMQSGHKFAHDVQNCGLIWSLLFKWVQREFLRDLDYKLINPLWNGPWAIVLEILASQWEKTLHL